MNTTTSTEAAAIADTGDTTPASNAGAAWRDEAPDFLHSATYSPDDNKIRIYPARRLDADEYARVKAAGFAWAPKQELFVAPMWTPARAALAIELCGEIGDEDTSLCNRAEERAERFDGYSDKRGAEAGRARDAVAQIADGIPFGQPIIVGHHSQRRAERDAEKIQRGMEKAVQLWETSEYWTRRAAGAIRAAKYKERPDVRARRIKGIEAEQRKAQKESDTAAKLLPLAQTVIDCGAGWKAERKDGTPTTPRSRCLSLLNLLSAAGVGPYGLWSDLDADRITPDEAQRRAVEACEARMAWAAPWLEHYANRLAYERAMLAEAGGLVAERFDLQPGGQVCIRGRWEVIKRVNRKDGAALSVSVVGRSWTSGIEEIKDYRPPTEEAAAAVKAVTTKAPLCNYPAPGSVSMTQAEWADIYADHKNTGTIASTDTHGAHRLRCVQNFIARKFGLIGGDQWGSTFVFISDAKRTDPPELNPTPKSPRRSMARKIAEAQGVDTAGQADEPAAPVATLETVKAEARAVLADITAPTVAETLAQVERMQARREAADERKAEGADFAAMREALRTGCAVQAVSAPQLFPTPADVAARMVELADLSDGMRVLEPSAGTGALIHALVHAGCEAPGNVVAVEQVHALAQRLRDVFGAGLSVLCRDFLQVDPDQAGLFNVVLMNPPFADGADVKHIQHARRFLAPGGRLVAICAAGPRQHAALQPLADTWEELPAGTFAGTNVRAVLLTMRAPGAPHPENQKPAEVQRDAIAAPAAEAGAAPAEADPAQVAAIVANGIRRRLNWTDAPFPTAAAIEREACSLDACCEQPDFTGPTAAAYRAAAVQLRAIAAAGPESDAARAALAQIRG